MQKDCNHCRGMLWDYVAKELSDAEAKKIEAHLQGCPSCRQEAEQVSLLVSALREEVPLPPSFSAELHEKLSRAAEEMAAEKPARRRVPRWGKFQTMAPALVCLALVVGVFSSGVYDQWRNADRMLTENPVASSAPSKSDPPAPVVTNPATTAPQPMVTEAPKPAKTETAAPATTEVPAPAIPEDSPAPASVAAEDAPGEAAIPAPASLEPEDTAGYALPPRRSQVVCLTLLDIQAFLDGWQKASGYTWKDYLQEADPRELLPGADSNATVLKLTPDAAESLLAFEESLNVTQDSLTEERTELLIIITEDEE